MSGYGVIEWKDGRFYQGQWLFGTMHGVGKYIWSDKKQYEGQYVNGKKHGFGVYQWPDGRLYKGYWKDGKQHGLAEYQVTQPTVMGHNNKATQSRYGLWKEGRRVKWFAIDPSKMLNEQLLAIEEEVITSLQSSSQRPEELDLY